MATVTFSALYLPLLLSALALLVCVISSFFFKAYLKRRTSREWLIQEGTLKEIREEIDALLKSIDETTDRNITLVTERERSLRLLIGEVEKRLKVYIREMEKRPVAEETRSALSGAGRASASVSAEPGSRSAGSDGLYVDLGKLRYGLKQREDPAPAAEPAPVTAAKEAPQLSPPAGDQVSALLKEGLSVEEVASRLKLSIAHVEFKAALMERRE